MALMTSVFQKLMRTYQVCYRSNCLHLFSRATVKLSSTGKSHLSKLDKPWERLPICISSQWEMRQHFLHSALSHKYSNDEYSGPEMQILDRLVTNRSEVRLELKELSLLIQEFCQTKYLTLQKIPWVQENVYIAFRQLEANKKLHVMNPVWNHEGMSLLISNVISKCDYFEPEDICQTFVHLLYLGLNPTSEVAQKLLLRALTLVPVMDVCSLELMSVIATILQRRWQSAYPQLKRLKELLKDPDVEWGPKEVAHIATISLNYGPMYRSELLDLTVETLTRVLGDSNCAITPDQLTVFSRWTHAYFIRGGVISIKLQQLAEEIAGRCPSLMDEMKPRSFAEICHCLGACYSYELELDTLFVKRGLTLLSENPRVCDLVNLMCCLQAETPHGNKKEFEKALMLKMSDVDVLLTTNLARSLLFMQVKDSDLIRSFQEQIVIHGEEIVQSAGTFSNVLRFLRYRNFLSVEHQQRFMDIVAKAADDILGLSPFLIENHAAYLISMMPSCIDEHFFQAFVKVIPKLMEPGLYKISSALTNMKRPTTIRLQEQLGQLQTLLNETIQRKKKKVPTATLR